MRGITHMVTRHQPHIEVTMRLVSDHCTKLNVALKNVYLTDVNVTF